MGCSWRGAPGSCAGAAGTAANPFHHHVPGSTETLRAGGGGKGMRAAVSLILHAPSAAALA